MADQDRMLSEAAGPQPKDDRPQFADVFTPVGMARVRRLQPEQLFVFLSDILPSAAIDAADISVASWGQHVAVAKLLQRCLVGTENNRLLYHGEEGLRRICSWPRARLVEVARAAAALMEF